MVYLGRRSASYTPRDSAVPALRVDEPVSTDANVVSIGEGSIGGKILIWILRLSLSFPFSPGVLVIFLTAIFLLRRRSIEMPRWISWFRWSRHLDYSR